VLPCNPLLALLPALRHVQSTSGTSEANRSIAELTAALGGGPHRQVETYLIVTLVFGTIKGPTRAAVRGERGLHGLSAFAWKLVLRHQPSPAVDCFEDSLDLSQCHGQRRLSRRRFQLASVYHKLMRICLLRELPDQLGR
jgi:hypothetical protein